MYETIFRIENKKILVFVQLQGRKMEAKNPRFLGNNNRIFGLTFKFRKINKISFHKFFVFLLLFQIPYKLSAAPDILAGDAFAQPGQIADLSISYSSEGTVTAIQFDLDFDPLATTPDDAVGGDALTNHQIKSRQIDSDTYRIVVYSHDSSPLGNGTLADVPFALGSDFSGKTDVVISSERLVDDSVNIVPPTIIENGTLSTPLINFSLDVVEDWNLFSVHLDPDPDRPETIFDEKLMGPVWRWGSGTEPGKTFEAVSHLLSKQAFWARFTMAGNYNLTGRTPGTSSVSIYPGWNIIGVLDDVEYPDDPEIQGKIWTWDKVNQEYIVVESTAELEMGKGYLIYSSDKATLFEE